MPTVTSAQPGHEEASQTFRVTDTLRVELEGLDADAREVVASIVWTPGVFTVEQRVVGDRPHAVELRFPSPRPSGHAPRDTVVLRWFPAQGVGADEAAPVVMILHSIHPGLAIAQAFANGLSAQGVHAFIVELPGFGHRRSWGEPSPGVLAVAHAAQGVGDARRAGDVIAALPGVDPDRLTIMGASLGGFAAAVTASLDARFDALFVYLAGGGVYDVVAHGRKDAAVLRTRLIEEGYTLEQVHRLTRAVEPLTLASRLEADKTWLVSARFDEVVTPANADRFAEAIGLKNGHHLWLEANHYTALFSLPVVLERLRVVAVGGPETETGGEAGARVAP